MDELILEIGWFFATTPLRVVSDSDIARGVGVSRQHVNAAMEDIMRPPRLRMPSKIDQ